MSWLMMAIDVKEEDHTHVTMTGPVFYEHPQNCRCIELEERCKKSEAMIVELKLEIEKKNDEIESLKAKVEELETEKNAAEISGKGCSVKHCGERRAGGVVDLTEEGEDDDRGEDKVLEYEKNNAESESHVWKDKFKELELCFLQGDASTALGSEGRHSKYFVRGKMGPNAETSLDDHLQTGERSGDLKDNCNTPGTSYNSAPAKHAAPFVGDERLESKGGCCRRIRKQLFYEEQILDKTMFPLTPTDAKPVFLNVINICDSDEESDLSAFQMATPHCKPYGKVCITEDHAFSRVLGTENEKISDNSPKTGVDNQNCEFMDALEDSIPCIATPKRKRAANIVTSDSESDEDDNTPICKLKRKNLQQSSPVQASFDVKNSTTSSPSKCDDMIGIATRSRRRLIRQCDGKQKAGMSSPSETNETKYQSGISTTDTVEDDESHEFGSDSEGESLGGFIVESSGSSVKDDVSSQSEDKSDGDMDFNEILSRLQRSKVDDCQWKCEADMLASFGKDPELCMKAICALYRQQTSVEQCNKKTFLTNNRGFSKFDAKRGSTLAEFLTGGDGDGDVQVSVEELETYDSKAVELCRTLATRYSKQLFEIYENKEDPFFLPEQRSV